MKELSDQSICHPLFIAPDRAPIEKARVIYKVISGPCITYLRVFKQKDSSGCDTSTTTHSRAHAQKEMHLASLLTSDQCENLPHNHLFKWKGYQQVMPHLDKSLNLRRTLHWRDMRVPSLYRTCTHPEKGIKSNDMTFDNFLD